MRPLQALKLDDDVAREVAVLGCLHAALQYAVTGATLHRSIQCVVLCVFTLHCCRGRGSAEQKQQRQCWHAQLSEALPSCDRAKWAIVEWMDPRLESHATQVSCVIARHGSASLAHAPATVDGSNLIWLPALLWYRFCRTGLGLSGTSGDSIPQWRRGPRL